MTLLWTAAWAVAWIGAALLLAAGTAKVVRPVATADALAMSGFPSSAPVARLLGTGEAVLGALVLASVVLPTPAAALAAGALGVAYLAFAAVAGRLLAVGASSCGCFGEVDAPLSRVHVAVNLVLAVAAGIAATGSPPAVGGPGTLALAATCVAVGAVAVRALLVLVPALADGIRRLDTA